MLTALCQFRLVCYSFLLTNTQNRLVPLPFLVAVIQRFLQMEVENLYWRIDFGFMLKIRDLRQAGAAQYVMALSLKRWLLRV